MADSGDRTLPATPRRRELARRRGLMPAASLPAWAAAAATAVLFLPSWCRTTFAAATAAMRRSLAAAIDRSTAPPGSSDWLAVVVPTLAVVAAAAAVGLAVRLVLDGPSWRPSRAAPTWQRVSPLAGLARIFSPATLAATVGHAAGIAVLLAAAVLASRPLVAVIASAEPSVEATAVFAAAHRALVGLVAAAVAVAVATWAVSRLRFERRIRMTPQEHAEEARGLQADPKVRLQRNRRHVGGK